MSEEKCTKSWCGRLLSCYQTCHDVNGGKPECYCVHLDKGESIACCSDECRDTKLKEQGVK